MKHKTKTIDKFITLREEHFNDIDIFLDNFIESKYKKTKSSGSSFYFLKFSILEELTNRNIELLKEENLSEKTKTEK